MVTSCQFTTKFSTLDLSVFIYLPIKMSDFNFVATDCRVRPWCAHQLRPADADGGGGEGGHQEHRDREGRSRGAAGAGAGWKHEREVSTHAWNVNAIFYGLFDQFSASNVMQFNFMLHLK